MLLAGGTARHHSAFHELFATAKWSVDAVDLVVYDLMVYDLIRKLIPQATVFLAGDDTLLSRCGLNAFGTGMHRDPLLSRRGFAIVRSGQ